MNRLLVALFFLLLYGCAQQEHLVEEAHIPQTVVIRERQACGLGQFDLERLEMFYQANNLAGFEAFLNTWNRHYQKERILMENTIPTFLMDAYEIFHDFYTPYNLSRIAEVDKETQEISASFSYFVIQDQLKITKRTTLQKDRFGHFLDAPDYVLILPDFSPNITVQDKKALQLSDYTRQLLLAFLGDESYPLGSGNIMSPARAKGESQQRQQFLNQFIPVFHGHWGGWHLESQPYVESINFDDDYREALVEFRIGYEGGDAHYKKRQGKWRLISSELLWME